MTIQIILTSDTLVKEKKYHQPEPYIIQNILNSLENISKISKKLNLKIINAGFDSKVEFFQGKISMIF